MAETEREAPKEQESEPAPRRPRKQAAKPEAAAPKPTPESIGIEGVVRVGGHHLDEEQGWVADHDTPAEKKEED